MGMPAQPQDLEWTVERAHALPDDGNRYEVLDGELFVTPAPAWQHQGAVGLLYAPLLAYVLERRIGWAIVRPADVAFSPRRLLQPDLAVSEWPTGWRVDPWNALALGRRRSDADAPRDQLAGQSETVIAMSGRSATSAPS